MSIVPCNGIATPSNGNALSLYNLLNLQPATLGKLIGAFPIKVALKFMNIVVKFNDEIAGVLLYLSIWQHGEHVEQWEGN